MKKILKEIKNLYSVYPEYRLIVTDTIIELKVTPKSQHMDEINWAVEHNKEGKIKLLTSLRILSENLGKGNLTSK